MEPIEDGDPFAESFAEHSWGGHELYPSVTHYYLCVALDRSPSFVDETSDLACLWVLMTPPARILELERRIRRDPDGVYAEIFKWIGEEAPRPNSPEFFEARRMVHEMFRQVADARDEVDPDSLEGGDAEGLPGKSSAEPATPQGSQASSQTYTQGTSLHACPMPPVSSARA